MPGPRPAELCSQVPRLWPWVVFPALLEWSWSPEIPKSSPSCCGCPSAVLVTEQGWDKNYPKNNLFCSWDSLQGASPCAPGTSHALVGVQLASRPTEHEAGAEGAALRCDASSCRCRSRWKLCPVCQGSALLAQQALQPGCHGAGTRWCVCVQDREDPTLLRPAWEVTAQFGDFQSVRQVQMVK